MDFNIEQLNVIDIIGEDGKITKAYDSHGVVILVIPNRVEDAFVQEDVRSQIGKFDEEYNEIVENSHIPESINFIAFNVEVATDQESDTSERYVEIVYFNTETKQFCLQKSSVNDDDEVVVNDFTADTAEDVVKAILESAYEKFSEEDAFQDNIKLVDYFNETT